VNRVRSVVAAAALVLVAAGCGGNAGDGGGGNDGGSNAGGSAEDWTPEFKDGVLQPLPDGFPEQSLHLINSDEPAHDDGLYARAMQTALKDISPVPVEVEDLALPQFGTWAALEYMADQPGGTDGYYAQVSAVTGAALDLLTDPIEEEFGMTLDDIEPIIATESTPFVMVTRSDAEWQSYDELVEYAKGNPGKLRYVASVGSRLDITMRRIMNEGGWEATLIPQDSSSDAATVVAAGEGDFTMLTPSVARAHEEAGKARVILVTSNEDAAPGQWSDATTTHAIGMPDEPWGSIRGFVVGADVPELHRQWLFEAFKAAADTDAHQERIDSVPGGEAIILDGAELKAGMEKAVKDSEPILRELDLLYGG
jgi:tripartite-type tricarboxylate transporter receptor subunit TctC